MQEGEDTDAWNISSLFESMENTFWKERSLAWELSISSIQLDMAKVQYRRGEGSFCNWLQSTFCAYAITLSYTWRRMRRTVQKCQVKRYHIRLLHNYGMRRNLLDLKENLLFRHAWVRTCQNFCLFSIKNQFIFNHSCGCG